MKQFWLVCCHFNWPQMKKYKSNMKNSKLKLKLNNTESLSFLVLDKNTPVCRIWTWQTSTVFFALWLFMLAIIRRFNKAHILFLPLTLPALLSPIPPSFPPFPFTPLSFPSLSPLTLLRQTSTKPVAYGQGFIQFSHSTVGIVSSWRKGYQLTTPTNKKQQANKIKSRQQRQQHFQR